MKRAWPFGLSVERRIVDDCELGKYLLLLFLLIGLCFLFWLVFMIVSPSYESPTFFSLGLFFWVFMIVVLLRAHSKLFEKKPKE